MLDWWNEKRNKRLTQKWRVISRDGGLFVKEEGYNSTYGMMSLFLIDQLPNYRKSVIMLKRVLADDGCCCCDNNNKATLLLLSMHCFSLIVLVEDDGEPVQMIESTEYAEILIDQDGSMKWRRLKKRV